MSFPRVSVVTVCFNAGHMLVETMENVLQQQYADLEYIIVDGGSTDGSVDIIRSYGSRVARFVSQPDHGIYDAMNKGVAMCTGQWVLFMNAGDKFASDDVLQRIFSQPHTSDVIYGDVIKNNRVIQAHQFVNSHRMCFCHQSALTQRKDLVEVPFDTSFKMSADFKFFKILGLQGKSFEHVSLPIAIFDTTGVSNASRSAGLLENIKVVNQTDSLWDRIRLLPRLYFTYYSCLIRGK